MPEPAFIDTNVLLRLLLDDDPIQSPPARDYVRQATAERPLPIVAATTVSELVYVLRGQRLAFDRGRAANAVVGVLELGVTVQDREVIATAAELLRSIHDDWDDCMVAAYAIERAGGRLVSFDRGLGRIPGLQRQEPGA